MLPENIAIGQKIHKRRGDFGYSLRDLAKKTSLTASFLSQIERGSTSPSLKSLRQIADALEVPLLFFLSDTTRKSSVVRADARPHIDLENPSVNLQLLTPGFSCKMEALIGSMDPGSGNVTHKLPIPTEELIMVLSGSLQIGLEEEIFILNPGDTIYFEGTQLTEFSCVSKVKATWLSVITPPVF
jgi:transcriptional regulator with XRE-family HTH domain